MGMKDAAERLLGMIRSPRATLARAIAAPRPLAVAALIVTISAICSAGFLMTRVGQLAALDQHVRQLESFGTDISAERYEQLRQLVPYRPAIAAAGILIGWPLIWGGAAAVLRWIGNRAAGTEATFAQVFTVVVHAASVFALRAVIAAPINYSRESLGGATSLSMVMPSFSESTFPARVLGAVDLFVLWWVVLVAMGLAMLYQVRTLPIARWLFGAYAAGAVALAITQALRGGI